MEYHAVELPFDSVNELPFVPSILNANYCFPNVLDNASTFEVINALELPRDVLRQANYSMESSSTAIGKSSSYDIQLLGDADDDDRACHSFSS